MRLDQKTEKTIHLFPEPKAIAGLTFHNREGSFWTAKLSWRQPHEQLECFSHYRYALPIQTFYFQIGHDLQQAADEERLRSVDSST